MTDARVGGWMITQSSRQVWPLDPRPEDFCVEDIAHALSNICRYGGHCREFYSVAQHSVLVSVIVDHILIVEDAARARRVAFAGLFHDAAEAYIGDMVQPLKRSMPEFRAVDHKIQMVIGRVIGIDPALFFSPPVRSADKIALLTERRDLLTNPCPNGSTWLEDTEGIKAADWLSVQNPLSPKEARASFLARYEELRG